LSIFIFLTIYISRIFRKTIEFALSSSVSTPDPDIASRIVQQRKVRHAGMVR